MSFAGADTGPTAALASPPVISSVSPAAGAPGGGTLVTLTGTNFQQATAVRFGATIATSFTVNSANQITAVSPPGSGSVQITVTTPNGTSNGVPFSFVGSPAPVLTSLTPTQGPAAGGTAVTITGTSLSGATAVRFGATNAASFLVVSATQIVAVAPAGSGTVQVTVTTPGGTSNGLPFAFVPAPTVSSVSPNQGPGAGGNTVTITGSGFSGATAVRFGSTNATSFTVVSPTQITAVAPPGSGTVQVTVITAGGTSNGLSYTYVAVPSLTSAVPNQGPAGGGNNVTLTGSGLSGATSVMFGSTPATSFIVVSATQVVAIAPPGTGTVQITVTTPGGTSNGVSYSYVVAPSLTSVSPNQGPAAGGNTVTITGSGLSGATSVLFGSTPATSFTVVSSTQITAVAPPGSGNVQVTVVTPGGTSNGVSYSYVVAPSLTSVSPNQGPAAGGNTVTITGSGLSGATAVLFGSTPATSFTVVSATQITAVAPAGTGNVQITVVTPGGTSNGVAYSFTSAPVLSSVSPTQGPPAGGNTVTLTGSGFTGATAVLFGSTPATSFTVVSSTQITATAPPGTGTVQVTVVTPGGTSNGVGYTYTSAPVLISAVPNQGPAGGGNNVTLTGSGLSGATSVMFGSTPATSFIVVSATQVVAIAPPGTGTVQITVTTPGGTSNGVGYTYTSAPVLSSVSPTQGPATGGNTVTLTGSGFTGATAVLFGSTAANSFTVVSPTQITVTAPPGSGTVQVTVTTPGGTSNGVSYTYTAAPVLTSISPSQGSVNGANTVTLTGSGFTGATAVTFGFQPAVSFTVVSSTQITAVVPPGSAGAVPVTVTTPGGTSNSVTYIYLAIPALTSVVPNQGSTTGGTMVTLTGSGFLGATAVLFGSTPATSFTVVSATQIGAVAPPGTGTVQITVVTPGGTSNGVPYTYVPVPVLTAVIPVQGPTTPGSTVTLLGTGLAATNGVLFGSTLVAFTVVSDGLVTATDPGGSAGPVSLTVTSPGGTSNAVTYTRVSGPGI
ncbi:IPT/TIG domain-containing protein [Streptomyces sp. HD1123-B1]|uniref:IPT/TIG domain-containing protein n=1 Tax=Streptomyces huangiella TaxID=3228804 RepID=UPI003D7CD76B